MTFKYTHAEVDVASSVVEEIYYNENTSELVVVLRSGLGYLYQNVPYETFDDFYCAASAGSFYATNIKRNFGPGENLGYVLDTDFERAPELVTTGVGMPKNLVYASNAKVSENTSTTYASGNVYPLYEAPAVDTTVHKHAVVFEANGAERVHTLDAESVDAAVKAV